MNVKHIILAALYRDAITAKRFAFNYITSFVLTILFPLALLYIPSLAMGISIETVTERLSKIVEVPFESPEEAVALLMLVSTLIGGISFAIWGAIDVLMDDMWVKTLDDALIATRLHRYIYAYLIAMTIIDVPLGYFPSAIAAMAVVGFRKDFVISALLLLPALMISFLSIGLFSTTISSFILRVREPWTVLNTLVPLLVVSSGIYFSIKLIPTVIALFALATPVPHATGLVKAVLTFKGLTKSGILLPFAMVTLAYAALSRLSIKKYEYEVRKHGAEIKI